MVTRNGVFGLALTLGLLAPGSAHGQWIVDLAGAWGQEERVLGVGLGYELAWPISVVGGASAVEHGLQPGYEWNSDRTEIYPTGATSPQVDPRDARTSPSIGYWARVEVQPSWWGGTLMWDPRSHVALGAFGTVNLAPRSHAVVELRWVKTLGHLLAFRLRFR